MHTTENPTDGKSGSSHVKFYSSLCFLSIILLHSHNGQLKYGLWVSGFFPGKSGNWEIPLHSNINCSMLSLRYLL